MNTKYTLKNFRVFDEQGATFEMAPITILTGCNSSGKSTITKSLMLLNEIFGNVLKDYVAGTRCYLEDYTLNFTKGIHNLGKFDSVVNDKSSKKEVCFEYTFENVFYNGDLTAQLTFVCDNNAGTQNGRFSKILILNQDDIQLYNLDFERGILECNIAILKDSFFSFTHDALLYQKLMSFVEQAQKRQLNLKEKDEYIRIKDELGEKLNIMHGLSKLIYDRDHLRDLMNQELLINVENHAKHKSLFYLDALEWLDGYKKVDVRRIIENHVKRSFITNKIVAETAENIKTKIKRIVDEFYRSEFQSFRDFYVHYEDLFLQNVQALFMSENSEERESFLWKIMQSLAYKNAGFDYLMGFIKDTALTYTNDVDVFWEHEKYRFIFIVHYMRMIMPSLDEWKRAKYVDAVDNEWFETPIFDSMILFLCNILEDILVDSPNFISSISFVDANRANVNRLYNFREQSSFNIAIQEYLSYTSDLPKMRKFPRYKLGISEEMLLKSGVDGKLHSEKPVPFSIHKTDAEENYDYSERYVKGTFTRKWLQKFDIADDFDIRLHAEGAGVSIVLLINGKERNLADFGFGVTQLFSLMMQIENSILKNQKELRKEEVESQLEGMSLDEAKKALENFRPLYKMKYSFAESYLAIEEPESHLHPNYQSMLVDMFYDAYQKYKINFIIETHSEYLVRKTQILVANEQYEDEQVLAEKCPFKVYYLPRLDEGKPYEMGYRTTGGFMNKFGEGFFDEAAKWDMAIIQNEVSNPIRRRR